MRVDAEGGKFAELCSCLTNLQVGVEPVIVFFKPGLAVNIGHIGASGAFGDSIYASLG